MKTVLKITTVLVLLFGSFAFGQKANTKLISDYVAAMESTTRLLLDGKISKDDCENHLRSEMMKLGYKIDDNMLFPVKNYSELYYTTNEKINSISDFSDIESYLTHLANFEEKINSLDLTIEEKVSLLNNIDFQTRVYKMFLNLDKEYSSSGKVSARKRCLASIIGGFISGGVAGCAGIGSLGGMIGSAIEPGLGTIIGAAAGCVHGGQWGALGGAILGYANGC